MTTTTLSGSAITGGRKRGSAAASFAGGKRKRRNKKQRGGFSSAWKQVYDAVGSGDTQFNNTFVKGGPFHGALQNVSGTQPSSMAMKFGGGSKKRRSGRSKKGGYWGQVLSQALVPFGLWGLQNRYSRGKKHLGNKTRKQVTYK